MPRLVSYQHHKGNGFDNKFVNSHRPFFRFVVVACQNCLSLVGHVVRQGSDADSYLRDSTVGYFLLPDFFFFGLSSNC